MSEKLIVLVTGAATGFGALTARTLAKSGHQVYAGILPADDGTNAFYEETREFARANKVHIVPVQLDVTDDASIRAAVDTIISEKGSIDGLIHNAGLLAYGPTESFLPEQFTKLLEVNLVGPQRVNRIVVPHMRRKGRGVLIFVSSASVYGSSAPFAGAYFASKAAVDSLAQVYQLELSPFGIETSIILPGFFPTGTNIFAAALRPGDTQRAEELWSPPSPLAGWDAVLQESGRKLLSPEARPQAVADAIDRVINAEHGKRPFRAIIEYDGGQTEISAGVHDLVRDRYLTRFGFGELLKPKN